MKKLMSGKKAYEVTGNSYNNYVIQKELSSAIYFIKVIQGGNIKTLNKLIKQE